MANTLGFVASHPLITAVLVIVGLVAAYFILSKLFSNSAGTATQASSAPQSTTNPSQYTSPSQAVSPILEIPNAIKSATSSNPNITNNPYTPTTLPLTSAASGLKNSSYYSNENLHYSYSSNVYAPTTTTTTNTVSTYAPQITSSNQQTYSPQYTYHYAPTATSTSTYSPNNAQTAVGILGAGITGAGSGGGSSSGGFKKTYSPYQPPYNQPLITKSQLSGQMYTSPPTTTTTYSQGASKGTATPASSPGYISAGSYSPSNNNSSSFFSSRPSIPGLSLLQSASKIFTF